LHKSQGWHLPKENETIAYRSLSSWLAVPVCVLWEEAAGVALSVAGVEEVNPRWQSTCGYYWSRGLMIFKSLS
jgi:hypothetical protein